ncbi:MAG: type II toxin-antitoxin system RelE/ParE family toxin [Synergistaceae bacterium]|nr:type II toxin-antitoxin system RelE/ParE family toxin [Synergistaceae bacterium]
MYVLHAFKKKSQTTPKKEIEIAQQRYKMISKEEL